MRAWRRVPSRATGGIYRVQPRGDSMRYRLTLVSERFFKGNTLATREFSADSDAHAIQAAESPAIPLRFVLPDGDGTCASVPRTLEEIDGMLMYRPVRLVKEW